MLAEIQTGIEIETGEPPYLEGGGRRIRKPQASGRAEGTWEVYSIRVDCLMSRGRIRLCFNYGN